MTRTTRPHRPIGARNTEQVMDNTAAVELNAALFESLVAAWAELLVADFRRRQAAAVDLAPRTSHLTAASA